MLLVIPEVTKFWTLLRRCYKHSQMSFNVKKIKIKAHPRQASGTTLSGRSLNCKGAKNSVKLLAPEEVDGKQAN